MSTKPLRILFTGGSGKAGRHVVAYLLDQGHHVVNVDQRPLDEPRVDNYLADITDPGQMFDVLSSYANMGELDRGEGAPRGFDAVVHFAAMPRNFITRDGFGITEAARDYLAPLIVGEAYPSYRAGLPRYVRLKNESVPRRLKKRFRVT